MPRKIRVTRTIIFESIAEDKFRFDDDEYADAGTTTIEEVMAYDRHDYEESNIALDELTQYEEVHNTVVWELVEEDNNV